MPRAVRIGIALAAAGALLLAASPQPLQIYFVDVEGGQSTLIVTPAGQSMLIDAGFPSDGTFSSKPGDRSKARDPQRILAAARAAGVSRIDYQIVTHFHGDHDGGIVELSQLMPIRTFVDHDTVPPEAEAVAGTLDLFRRYAAVRGKARHIVPAAGDRLPLDGVDVTVVSSGGQVLPKPLAGAGSANAACAAAAVPAQEPVENPRSTGVLVRFGRFRFLDVGDLSGAPLRSLVCPIDRIGPVDVYLVAHHGGPDSADPATYAVWKPRVAVVNNGPRKGGAPEAFAALHARPGVEVFQLHRSDNEGARNFADDNIANLDETTAHWIEIEAEADGSFAVMNQRTGSPRRFSASSNREGR